MYVNLQDFFTCFVRSHQQDFISLTKKPPEPSAPKNGQNLSERGEIYLARLFSHYIVLHPLFRRRLLTAIVYRFSFLTHSFSVFSPSIFPNTKASRRKIKSEKKLLTGRFGESTGSEQLMIGGKREYILKRGGGKH